MDTDGPHHATAAASDPQENRQFDTEPLGLRVVTRSVDVDDTTTHHRYNRTRIGESGAARAAVPVEDAWPESPPGEPERRPGMLADGGVAE